MREALTIASEVSSDFSSLLQASDDETKAGKKAKKKEKQFAWMDSEDEDEGNDGNAASSLFAVEACYCCA